MREPVTTFNSAAEAALDGAVVTSATSSSVVRWCEQISASPAFQNLILGVIVANAIVIGLETSATLVGFLGAWLQLLNHAAQAIFTVEIAIRLTAHWPRALRFFRSGWNSFDFAIVVLAFVPATSGLSNLARLARVTRATRIVSATPQLRLVIETVVRSIPSMGHILLLLGLFLYVYAIVGFYLFADNDPARWGSLGAAMLALFQLLTLENWTEIQNAVSQAHPASWLFFTSFIVVAVWVVMSLFIAVVVNNLDAAKQTEAREFDIDVPGEPMAHIAEIRQALARLEQDIRLANEADRSVRD